MNALDRIGWAVKFAAKDLENLTVGDLLNLREQLIGFLGSGGGSLADLGGILVVPLQAPFPRDFEREDFQMLQKDVRELLKELTQRFGASRQWELKSLRFSVGPIGDPPDERSLWTRTLAEDRIVLQQVTGSSQDLFLYLLIQLFAWVGLARLLRCPNCGTVLWKIRRRKYCSRKCANRISYKNWRARKPRSDTDR